MKSGGNILKKLTVAADLPDEAIPGLPLVEIAGDCRVLIENHQGVIAYAPEEICIKVSFGTVSVCGFCLELTRMTKGQLIISGKIRNVNLHGGNA